jgi:hypothetical protein
VGIVAVFVFLLVAFWVLQVLQYAEHRDRAERNYTRTISLLAPRGMLFDRHGQVLVNSRQSFRIAIVREQSTDLKESVRRLADATRMDESQMWADVERRRTEALYRPIVVIEHATDAQIAAVFARKLELPEVVVEQVPMRTYPEGGLAAHIFGYTGEVQPAQLERAEFADLSPGAIVGQTGLERIYNPSLMGTDGNRFVIIDSRGREVDELERQEPIDGHRVQLTIDADMQRALEGAFPDIATRRRFPRALECCVDAVRDEMECRAARHGDRRARMVREYEDRHLIGRVVAPPAFPGIVGPGAAHRAEHVAPEDPRPEIVDAARREVVVDPGRAAVFAEQFPEGAGRDEPFMQGHGADAERIFQTLAGTGAVAVEGDGETMDAELAHAHGLSPGRRWIAGCAARPVGRTLL